MINSLEDLSSQIQTFQGTVNVDLLSLGQSPIARIKSSLQDKINQSIALMKTGGDFRVSRVSRGSQEDLIPQLLRDLDTQDPLRNFTGYANNERVVLSAYRVLSMYLAGFREKLDIQVKKLEVQIAYQSTFYDRADRFDGLFMVEDILVGLIAEVKKLQKGCARLIDGLEERSTSKQHVPHLVVLALSTYFFVKDNKHKLSR